MTNPNLADVTVLIPAAGRVPSEPQFAGTGCPAMLPVGGRPVVYWTLRYLRELGLRKFIIAVAERGLYVEEYVRYIVDDSCDVRFIKPSVDGGIGRTIHELAELVETPAALVVLGDTFFRFADPAVLQSPEPAVLVHEVEESFRWCIAEVDAAGRVAALRDKEPNLPGTLSALIGVYYFPSVERLRGAARAAVAASAGRKTEMSAILRNVASETPLRALTAAAWQDCGNADLQIGSHQKMLESRAFNHLHVDPLFGMIRKRSERAEKLIDEINYLRLLPPELAVLFPRLVDFSIDANEPWMRLEYFGFPTLAEIFLYERQSASAWRRIFRRLRSVLCDCFQKWPRNIDVESLQSMYLTKPRRRLESLTGPPELLRLVRDADRLVVNGRPLQNLSALWPQIDERIERISRNCAGAVIHGDFCLSNILYDWRSDVCKLIDPRGSFGSAGIYGDPRYDVAKLYHSVYGLYDFIVHDLFHVAVDGDRVTLEMGVAPHHLEVKTYFEQVFFPLFDREEILLLTALLFVSMPPLHYDRPQRQVAMYVRGLQLLDELFHGVPQTNLTPSVSAR
jgi:dTDP-glucose pyrophosphorylase